MPQFYLRRFTDSSGRLWLWERDQDRVLASSPKRVAGEKNFYYLAAFVEQGHDPLTIERQFSDLEGQVALVTEQWLHWLRHISPGAKIAIPDTNREMVSLYVALQFLRTANTRDILVAFDEERTSRESTLPEEKRRLHTEMLWNEDLFRGLADRIKSSIWVFGYNRTSTPFLTSDNPVAFRARDNSMWLKVAFRAYGAYVVFPLAPDIVMYCYPNEAPWEKLAMLDATLSPVSFTKEMVESENSAQVFMASRFVFSSMPEFDFERQFAKTIGTDIYRRTWGR